MYYLCLAHMQAWIFRGLGIFYRVMHYSAKHSLVICRYCLRNR